MDLWQIILDAMQSIGWPESLAAFAVMLVFLYFFVINPKTKKKKTDKEAEIPSQEE